jgi:hypothetical protein
MTSSTRIIATATTLLLAVLLGRTAWPAARLPAAPAAVTAAGEAWRLGVTSEGSASYDSLVGRPAEITAAFRSNRGVTDMYFIFPAPGRTVTVQAAAYDILRRTGTYTGSASLALEVRGFDGSLKRTVSAAPVDLQSAAIGGWSNLTLAASPANLALAPGEALAFHFALDGISTGDLDVRPAFEVLLTGEPTLSPTSTATSTATATPTATATAAPTKTPVQHKLDLPIVQR